MNNPLRRPPAAVISLTALVWLAWVSTALSADPAAAPAPEVEPKVFVVGFAQDTMANDWRAAQVREVAEELARHPDIRFIHTDAGGRTAQQVVDIEDLAERGVDLLMTSPRDARAMAPVIAAVHRRGIPVILLTRRVLGEDYTAFVGPDDRAIAADAARYLAERLGGEGRILVLQGVPSATTAIARTEGFLTALEGYPGLKVVAVEPADYLRHKAIFAVERVLAAGLEFDAIFAQSDSMAAGARMALRQAGIDPAGLPIVGIDYIPEAREAIRAGEQAASFTYPTCGREGAALAVRLLHGEPIEREVTVDSVRVTADNVEDVEPIF